jgi:hypothetical protein
MSKAVIGLVSILAGVVLARVAIHFSYPAPGMTPEQIWYAMSPGFKTAVLAGWLLLVYGCWSVLKGALKLLGGRKRV